MDNPNEGEHQQTPHTWPDSETVPPDHLLSGPPPQPAPITPIAPAPPSPVNNTVVAQHPNNTVELIFQWLTYTFWGNTIFALSLLTGSFFDRLISGNGTATFNYYVIASLVVLVPISFICDFIYSKKEPDRKTGPASLIMVVYAVIFALFAIGSLVFAAWSVVAIAIDQSNRSSDIAGLISSIVIGIYYAGTFMRTLNPAHISWIPKIYRYVVIGLVVVFTILGFVRPTFSSTKPVINNQNCNVYANSSSGGSDCSVQTTPNTPSTPSTSSTPANTFTPSGKLQPSAIGGTQCDNPSTSDGATTGQMAVSGGATCAEADAVIQDANNKEGTNYSSNGYTCTATKQGSNTQWSSYWNNNFYTYSCASGSKQLAFNIQTTAQGNSGSTTTN
ncbi:MAG: hypothetical protein ACHQT9_02095 [Candidatus Saccharimonadales bacterium]